MITRQMVDKAVDIVVAREGRPREDDWELMEAAQVLAGFVVRVQQQQNALVDAMVKEAFKS